MSDIPVGLMKEIGLASASAEVLFTQTSIEYSFRDAVQFPNGKVVSLRRLKPGQKIRVLSTGATEVKYVSNHVPSITSNTR